MKQTAEKSGHAIDFLSQVETVDVNGCLTVKTLQTRHSEKLQEKRGKKSVQHLCAAYKKIRKAKVFERKKKIKKINEKIYIHLVNNVYIRWKNFERKHSFKYWVPKEIEHLKSHVYKEKNSVY